MTHLTDFRSLCAELASLIETYPPTATAYWAARKQGILDRARTALSTAPQQGAPSDEEILAAVRHLYGNETAARMGAEDDIRTARAVLTRYGAQAVPVAVAEKLPGEGDVLRRNDSATLNIARDDEWCWGQERSLLTGNAAARWRFMRVSALEDEAVNWLPHWALPLPEAQP